MPNHTVTTAAVFIPEVWNKDISIARDRFIALAPTIDRVDSMVKAGGDTIHTPRLANLVARDKAAGTAVTFDATTEGEILLNVTSHKYHAITFEDIALVQATYDLRRRYTDKMGEAIGVAFENEIASRLNAAGVTQTVGSASNTTTRIALTYITAAARYLDLANVPTTGDRYLAVDAYGMEQLRNISDFTRYDALGQTKIENGRLGNIFGFEVVLTNSVGAATAVVANVGTMFAYHRDAVQGAIQKLDTVGEYSVDQLGWKVAVQQIHGTVAARPDHAVKIYAGIG